MDHCLSEHAEKYGFGVVERFVGHGVGTVFHSEPIILHNRNEKPGCMVEGQTFTIGECISFFPGNPGGISIIHDSQLLFRFLWAVELLLSTFPLLTASQEPILTMGSIECVTWPDNWTTLTADGSPAAQFEHTILITRTGAEILTQC
ncbi:hypothetical protein Pint_23323 [Pistacia integerrima]|uniref:Uncharacterized protein n=1 Tax=Pistacia integerrima TaxID=434235 RepID=A0ACC0YN18_9ROSI|nr:hypothetical protein Pint_23323 [Pistacia integerrima]